MALIDPGIGIDPFAQFRVLARLHAHPFGRIASVVHIGPCWNAFSSLRKKCCKQT